ncbi:MAG TPA: aldo/keto reductase [Ktedonobacteraceae bacterium]|nr:aldo/keto reductase [Ktedonobacteraceae bacterium]
MIQLDQRQLGKSGIVVPALGVGVWSWGDKSTWGYGTTYTRADISQAYRACLDAGLNFFDTAEIYGNGASERILGECMREDNRPAIIASKFAPLPNRLSASKLLDALDASLARLGVQSIDLYQIHFPYTFLNKTALMDMMARAFNMGKIRAVGVSNYNVKQMKEAHARLARYGIPLASNQVHYSLLHRKPEENGVLDACHELDVALIAYSPLQQGLLTGKYRAGRPISITGMRRFMRAYSTSALGKIEPLIRTMETIAKTRGKTTAQVALNWLLTKDDHIIPIPGAKNQHQATDNAAATGWRLTPEEFRQIDQASREM